MTFLPIVGRELRVAARRRGTYWLRLLVALLAIVVGGFVYVAHARGPTDVLGSRIFIGLAGVAFIYCIAAGRAYTADCLSEEKREGTLGLLFLTSLRGYDVVLGKLAATSLNGFYGLVAIVPILAVPLLMGGISNGEFWRMVLVLLNTFFFSLATGILSSTLSSKGRGPMGLNFALLLLLVGAGPLIAGATLYFGTTRTAEHWLLYPCPVYAGVLSFDFFYKANADHFWCSVVVTHLLAWVQVGLASLLVPHVWQDTPSRSKKRTWAERWEAWNYGTGETRRALRKRLLNINPFFWLASRSRHKRVGAWVALVLVIGWWIVCSAQMRFRWAEESLVVTTAILVNILFKTWFAIEASQRLAEDQRLGALELLLSTPLNTRTILRGQALALRRLFLGPLAVALLLELILAYAAAATMRQDGERFQVFAIKTALMFAADLLALFWVGIWCGLTAKSPNHAAFATILRILLLPAVAFAAFSILITFWASLNGPPGPDWRFYLGLWFWLGLLTDLAFGLRAWSGLRAGFREVALRRTMVVKASQ
jgi:hypothetical protein